MRQRVRAVARELRLGHVAAGSHGLAAVVEELASRLSAPAHDLDATTLLPVLRAVLAAQERGDHLFVADLLEGELARLVPDDPR